MPHARELEAARLPRRPLPPSAILPAYSILEFAEAVARREGVEDLGASVIRTGMDHEAVAFPRALLARPLVRPGAKARGEPAPDDPDVVLADLADWTERLGAVLGSGIRCGFASLRQSAEVLGMGARTLQRRLRSVGLTHSDLVERARVLEAQRLLRDPRIPIREVAHRVGYGSSSNFARAYRRQTGSTPSTSRTSDSAS